MGEEKELKKQSLPVPLSNTKLTASIWRCINTPRGYRDRHIGVAWTGIKMPATDSWQVSLL